MKVTVKSDQHDLPGEPHAVREAKQWLYDRLEANPPTVSQLDWMEAALHQAYEAGYKNGAADASLKMYEENIELREALADRLAVCDCVDSEYGTSESKRRAHALLSVTTKGV